MNSTLFLNPDTWDLALDIWGNIALAQAPYATAQDVASAVKLFAGELHYDTAKGIPYFDEILGGGQKQSFALYRHRIQQAALSVPNVLSADVGLSQQDGRTAIGNIIITDQQKQQFKIGLKR